MKNHDSVLLKCGNWARFKNGDRTRFNNNDRARFNNADQARFKNDDRIGVHVCRDRSWDAVAILEPGPVVIYEYGAYIFLD